MKKRLLLLFSCLLVAISMQGQTVSSVSLDKPTLALPKDSTGQILAILNPGDAANQGVTWESSDSSIVDITSSGLFCDFTAKSAGTATITVTTDDGSYTATCAVTVANPISVTGVTLNESTLTLLKDSTNQLTATIAPGGATNQNVTWTSSDASVIELTPSGLTCAYVAKTGGNATITVTTADGSYTATCDATVTVPVTNVTLNKTALTLTVGGSETLTATVDPNDATSTAVTWSSEDVNIAAVNATSGLVAAMAPGTVKIFATADGKSDSCLVTVTATVAVTGVTLDKKTLPLDVGQTGALNPTVAPANATNKAVTYLSVDPAIATVSAVGLIKAIKTGETKVIVTTADGSKKDTCVVKVNNLLVTRIDLNKDSVGLTINDTIRLVATITPYGATNQVVTWSSLDSTIAAVSQAGTVRAKKEGITKVIVTTQDGGKKDTCIVTVSAKTIAVTSVKLDKDSAFVTEGESFALKATVLPDTATNKNVTWLSVDQAIATVSNVGVVTTKKAGKTKIIVTTVNGSKKDTCEVTVKEKLVFVEPDTTKMNNGVIDFALNIPANATLTGSFTIQFPTGITLDMEKTVLTSELAAFYLLQITPKANNTWLIAINPKTMKSAVLRAASGKKVMELAYVVAKSTANKVYDVKFINIDFKLSNSTVIKQENLTTQIKVDITQGSELIEGQDAWVYMANNRLYIQTPKAETVYVYSFGGQLLFSKEKAEGEAQFDVNVSDPFLIVKGASGWVRKVANKN